MWLLEESEDAAWWLEVSKGRAYKGSLSLRQGKLPTPPKLAQIAKNPTTHHSIFFHYILEFQLIDLFENRLLGSINCDFQLPY